MHPAAMTDAQLAAARFTPQQLLGLAPHERELYAQDHPANLLARPTFAGIGGPAVASDIIIPNPLGGKITVPAPGPTIDTTPVVGPVIAAASAAGPGVLTAGGLSGAAAAATDAGSSITSSLTSSVLGPIAEVVFGFVLAAGGVALVVWALIELGNRSGATKAAGVAAAAAA